MKDYTDQLITNFELIKQEINHLSKTTSIVVASKTMSLGDIETLYNIGQYAFAENYFSEFKTKTSQLQHLKNIEWHFIGSLQSNKLKYIASVAKWIHSLEKEAHAIKLNQILQNQNISDISQTQLSISPLELEKSEELKKYKKSLNVLIQINISNEDNKHGLRTLEAITNLANTITQQSNLCFRGLMGMASNTQDIEQQTKQFTNLANIFVQLQRNGFSNIDTLSMGMSNDYLVAIKCGSTMVRIGSKIKQLNNANPPKTNN